MDARLFVMHTDLLVDSIPDERLTPAARVALAVAPRDAMGHAVFRTMSGTDATLERFAWLGDGLLRANEIAHGTLSRLLHDQAAVRPDTRLRGGLAPYLRRRLADWIEAHLHEPITLGRLAELACLSEFHVARMFRTSFGLDRGAAHRPREAAAENGSAAIAAGGRCLRLRGHGPLQPPLPRGDGRAAGPLAAGDYRKLKGKPSRSVNSNLNGIKTGPGLPVSAANRQTRQVRSLISRTISSPYEASFFSPTPETPRSWSSDVGLALAISRSVASTKIT